MSVLATLLAVFERSTADRVVLCPGERPHAVTADGRRDVGTATLSPAVVSALTAEVLSIAGRQALARGVTVIEDVRTLPCGDVVVAHARQQGNEIRLELRRQAKTPESLDAAPVHEYIELARAAGATALYLRTGGVPAMRVNGRIRFAGSTPLDARTLGAWQQFVRNSWTVFDDGGDDRWIHRGETGTVHCRMFRDAQGSCATLTFAGHNDRRSRLSLPPRAIQDVCEARDGLLIVSAPAQAEVALMVSAAASFAGTQRSGYVIVVGPEQATVDDVSAPLVSRRAVSATEMASAVDAAAAEQPDVLVVVGPSSPKDVDAAVRAAAGERLVIVGVVARDAVDAAMRIAWDRETDGIARSQFAQVFQGAFAVRSVRQLGGGHITAYDVVKTTPEVVHAIEDGDETLLRAAHRAGVTRGRNADAELARAVVRRRLSLRTAVGHASDPSHLIAMVRRTRRRPYAAVPSSAQDPRVPEWTDLTSAV